MDSDIDAIIDVLRIKSMNCLAGEEGLVEAGRHQHAMASTCSLEIVSQGAQLPQKGRKAADGCTDIVVWIGGYCNTEKG